MTFVLLIEIQYFCSIPLIISYVLTLVAKVSDRVLPLEQYLVRLVREKLVRGHLDIDARNRVFIDYGLQL